MFEIIFKIWYFIVLLPVLILIEGSTMFSNFLKKRNIYYHWDVWHSSFVIAIIILIVLFFLGYRW